MVTEINFALNPACLIGAEIKDAVFRAEYRKTSITRSPNNEPKYGHRGEGSRAQIRSSIFLRASCHSQHDIFTSGEKPSEQSRTVRAKREIARRIREREIVCVFVLFVVSHRGIEVRRRRRRRNSHRRQRGAG